LPSINCMPLSRLLPLDRLVLLALLFAPSGSTALADAPVLTSFEVTGAGPVLTSISPSATNAGGPAFTLTVNGSGFTSSAEVEWGMYGMLPTTFVSSTQLTVQVPAYTIASAGTIFVTVLIDGASSYGTSFTVNSTLPSITTLSPSSAAAGSGDFTLTVNGSNFVSSSVIQWGGVALPTTYVGSTRLTALVSAIRIVGAGPIPVTVVNPGGQVSTAATFTVTGNSVPTLTSLSPPTLAAGGPDFALTVNGGGFVSGSYIRWNGLGVSTTDASTNQLYGYISAAQIAGPGTASITVINPGGAISNTLALTITGTTQSIASLSPSSAVAGSPDFTLTLYGTGFVPGSAVQWMSQPIPTTFLSSNQLTAQVTAFRVIMAGSATVAVANPVGTLSNALTFTVTAAPAPTLTSLSPSTAITGSSPFALSVNGTGFQSNAQVQWNGTGLSTTLLSATQLSAQVPAYAVASAGSVRVTVSNPSGSPSNALTFTITPPTPVVSSLFPASTAVGAPGFTLTVNGSGFVAASQVLWNGSGLVTGFVSNSQLTAQVPATRLATAGTASVSVSTPGVATSNVAQFSISAPAPPSVTAVSPDHIDAGTSGITLSVSGTHFASGAVINWSGTPLVTTAAGLGQLSAVVPATLLVRSGTFDLSVANPDGTVSAIFREYVNPVLQSVVPASAPNSAITLSAVGVGFVPTDVVRLTLSGTTTDLPTTFASSTSLSATVAASTLASASVRISVVDPSAGTASQSVPYIPAPAPLITSLVPPSAIAGGPDFTLTLNGSAFDSGSVVLWNGSRLATTYISASQLTASVPASLIFTSGTASISVIIAAGVFSNAISYAIGAALPITTTAGIVNMASSLPSIAPGSLVAIYGANLAAQTAQADTLPLPVTLGGTQVLIGGTSVPLLFVSPGQINAQIPFETAAGTTTLVVQSTAGAGAPVNFTVTPTGPGVITAILPGHALAVSLTDGSLNSPQSPAVPGDFILVYVTGQGLLNPAVPTGAPSPADPLSYPYAPVQVNIGGQPASVPFAGMAPGFVGLLQLNIQIPYVPAGDQNLDVTIGGLTANRTIISVANAR
jgi:trimeric autotransporter adhesin